MYSSIWMKMVTVHVLLDQSIYYTCIHMIVVAPQTDDTPWWGVSSDTSLLKGNKTQSEDL